MVTDSVLNRYTRFILVLLLFCMSRGHAVWYPAPDANQPVTIEKAIRTSGEVVYAVGTKGNFYKRLPGTSGWISLPTGVTDDFRTISAGGQQNILILAGENGLTARSADGGESWEFSRVAENTDLFASAYQSSDGRFWLGGTGPDLYYSEDSGLNWQTLALPEAPGKTAALFEVDISPEQSLLYAISSSADSSVVYYISPDLEIFREKSLPGVRLLTGTYMEPRVFLAGVDSYSQEGLVFFQFLINEKPGPVQARDFRFNGIPLSIAGVQNPETGQSLLLIGTDEGQIHESTDNGISWRTGYSDPFSRRIPALIAPGEAENDTDDPILYAIIRDGQILENGFELIGGQPFINDLIPPGLDRISLEFTQVPRIETIQSGLTLRSSYSGVVPFEAAYEPGDSSRVSLRISRFLNPGSIPGEAWNVSLSSAIQDNTVSANALTPLNYNVSFLPLPNPDFNFAVSLPADAWDYPGTNFVTGWFNDDDDPDLIIYADDRLFIYTVEKDGSVVYVKSEGFPIAIQILESIDEQLLATDLDMDGDPDLLLYDDQEVYTIINQSTGLYNFQVFSEPYIGSNIRQILLYNANHNRNDDMLILGDSLHTVLDIGESFSSSSTITHSPDTDYKIYTKMETGDINADGLQDIVLLSPAEIAIFTGMNDFTLSGRADLQVASEYQDIKLADIDRDHIPEIIVHDGNTVDIYTPDRNDFSTILPVDVSPLLQNEPAVIRSLVIQDFGQRLGAYGDGLPDIMTLTDDGWVKIFENTSFSPQNYGFVEQTAKNFKISLAADEMRTLDLNRDGRLDLLVNDRSNSQHQTVLKTGWAPEIGEAVVTSQGIDLSWQKFDEGLGTFRSYRLYRSEEIDKAGPSVIHESFEIDDTTYTDPNVETFRNYTYVVQAFYDEEIESDRSKPVSVPTFKYLTNPLPDLIADSTFGYIVSEPVSVPEGDSLLITEGIEIVFETDAAFDIFGRFEVKGSESRMVNFSGQGISSDMLWNGIHLHAGADTVRFEWCSVSSAVTAIRAEERPFEMKFGGLALNQVAIAAGGDTLTLENVSIDSNGVAAVIDAGARAFMKNINVFHSQNGGITVDAEARLRLKNSILWFNNSPALQAADGSDAHVSYTTIDSWQGAVQTQDIGRLTPLFLHPDSGYYRVALMSPTIDAGDPADRAGDEPRPNGNRINQGLYGGTWLATPTFQPRLRLNRLEADMASKPERTDSLTLIFHNDGNVELNIDGYEFSAGSGVFHVPTDETYSVAPGDSAESMILFTPAERVEYRDTLLIYSDDPHKPETAVYLSGVGLNSPPVLSGSLPDTVWVGDPIEIRIPVWDEDNDSLTFTAVEIPAWLTLEDGGILRGMPSIEDTSTVHTLEVRINDDFDDSVILRHDFTVDFVNRPPVWEGPVYLQFVEDVQPSPYDLEGIVRDENTPFERIEFDVEFVDDSLHISAFIADGHFLAFEFAPDYFNTEQALVVISATDIEGLQSQDSVYVQVEEREDAPRFYPVPDTTIYTNVLFNYHARAWDVDGQKLTFSDNSGYFDIEPDSGLIRFIPTLQDTGSETVVLEYDDGIQSVQDTFNLTVKINPVKAPEAFAAQSRDQAVVLTFTIPEQEVYTGTRVYYSLSEEVLAPNQGTLVIDTVLTNLSGGETVSVTVNELQIDQLYKFSIFNYFEQNGLIYSPPLRGEARTLAPSIQVNTEDRIFELPVNRELNPGIQVLNRGGGTLLFRFDYQADSLVNVWFDADTTQQVLAPGDSATALLHLHPDRLLPRRDLDVWLKILSNDREQRSDSLRIILRPVFDEFPPRIVMISKPDSFVRESAALFEFMADDTTELPIGDSEEQLWKAFRLINFSTSEIMAQGDSMKTNQLMLYPLDDGIYRLRLWAYDTEGNGRGGQQGEVINFAVSASRRLLPGNRWNMLTIPRPVPFRWQDFIADSLIKLFRWNNEENRYLPVLFNDSDQHEMGQAFWVFPSQPVGVDVRSYAQSGEQDSLMMQIEAGWNQVGTPLGYATDWQNMFFRSDVTNRAYTFMEAVQNQILAPAVFWYRHDKQLQGYDWAVIDSAVADPWRGYWLKSNHSGRLMFTSTPSLRHSLLGGTTDTSRTLARAVTGWQVDMTLTNDLYIDRKNIFGISTLDKRQPIPEPPHISEYCSFYFDTRHGPLTRDIKAPFDDMDDVISWDVTVETRSGILEHELTWKIPEQQLSSVYLFLVDQQREQIVDMFQQNGYSFRPAQGIYHFTIYATQDASFSPKIVPLDFKLTQNYPNPFNPRTTIRFGIPESADGKRITLKVFNVLGQEIATLVDRHLEMGYHEVEWSSRNQSGQMVSSGVYFYKLSNGSETIVRKMILVR